MRLCIVQPSKDGVSETFLRSHERFLPYDVSVLHDIHKFPRSGDAPIAKQAVSMRLFHQVWRKIQGVPVQKKSQDAFRYYLKKHKIDLVLAEYGPSGVWAVTACKNLNVPLVVHFHGFDASVKEVLDKYRCGYDELFDYAKAIVVVSEAMKARLLDMGAPPDKVYCNPCGVDTEYFECGTPASASQVFLSVGRFVEKKAPYLTLCAFSKVLKRYPEAKLRMVGDGPLLGLCKDLARALQVGDNVEFLGSRSHAFVKQAMLSCRGFVQHSIEASDGDCEGTPVAVLEASASGLPVVASAHAGISDVVKDGITGFLFEEKDVDKMASYMMRLLASPQLANDLGKAGRARIVSEYSMEKSIFRLSEILDNCSTSKTS